MPQACELRSNRPLTNELLPCPERAFVNRSFELIDVLPDWQRKAHGANRLLFIHVLNNAVVDRYGFLRTENVDVFLYPCHLRTASTITVDQTTTPHYEEVYVISVNYPVFFHATIESIPRLIPHLDFLKRNPQIKIHAHLQGDAKTAIRSCFTMLGLEHSRLVSGLISATVVYLPNAGGCINSLQPNVQAFANLAEKYARNVLGQPFGQRKYIVLLQRAKTRQLHQIADITAILLAQAHTYGLELHLYSDLTDPALDEMLLYFQNSVLIVGAHGGGLANMIWTPPGGCVIEIMCKYGIGPRFIFNKLAVVMGHHYHGILATSGSSYDLRIDLRRFEATVTEMLNLYFTKSL